MSRALLFLLASTPVTPAVAKGPYVTSVSDSAATVRFELPNPAPAVVEVVAEGPSGGGPRGDGGGAALRFPSPSAAMHVVALSALAPATRYAYTVRVAGAAAAAGHVLTAPAVTVAATDATAPHTFIVYGDDRTDDDAHAAVVRAMAAAPADFLVNTGDMVADGGSAANWTTFFDIERDLLRERALFSAIGNHELYDDAAGANFARYFGFADASGAMHPYGTLRFGAVRFFFLNGVDDWSGGPEREWLERALASADAEPGVAWRFAVVHQGPWSAGPHGPNARLVASRVPELLAAHGVDLVFSGHDHIYERGDAGLLKYLVSGGGGAPLYRDIHPTGTTRKAEATHHFIEVTTRGDAFRMLALRLDGSVLDQCGFTKGGPWDCDPASPAPSTPAPGTTPVSTSTGPPLRSTGGACGIAPDPGARFRGPVVFAWFALFAGSVRRYARGRCASSLRPWRR